MDCNSTTGSSTAVELDEGAKRHEPYRAHEKRAPLEPIEPAQKKCQCADRNKGSSYQYYRDPKNSSIYLEYVSGQQEPYFPFPKLFGLPQCTYLQLLQDLKRNESFQLWYNKNHDPDREPVELLLLGLLTVLRNAKYGFAKDITALGDDAFRDLSFTTYIAPEIHHRFFHYMLFDGFSTVYYNYVHGSSFVVTADMLEHLKNFANFSLFGLHNSKMQKRLREIRKSPVPK